MKCFAVLIQQLQVGLPVLVVKKDNRAVIATLGDMVRVSQSNYASDSWHERSVAAF